MDWADCYAPGAHMSCIKYGICTVCNTPAKQIVCFYCAQLGCNVCQYEPNANKNIQNCYYCELFINNFEKLDIYDKLGMAFKLRPETADVAKKYLREKLALLHEELLRTRHTYPYNV